MQDAFWDDHENQKMIEKKSHERFSLVDFLIISFKKWIRRELTLEIDDFFYLTRYADKVKIYNIQEIKIMNVTLTVNCIFNICFVC